MKFGKGSTTELTQKREGQSTKMPYVRPNIYINKQTSPIFNCVTPVINILAVITQLFFFFGSSLSLCGYCSSRQVLFILRKTFFLIKQLLQNVILKLSLCFLVGVFFVRNKLVHSDIGLFLQIDTAETTITQDNRGKKVILD